MKFEGKRRYRTFAVLLLGDLTLLFFIFVMYVNELVTIIFGVGAGIMTLLAVLSVSSKSEVIIENGILKYYMPLENKKKINIKNITNLEIQPEVTIELGRNRMSSTVDQTLNIESKDTKTFFIRLVDFKKDLSKLITLIEQESNKEIKNKFLLDDYLQETRYSGIKTQIKKL